MSSSINRPSYHDAESTHIRFCRSTNSLRRVHMSTLARMKATIQPSGFIFMVGRCGSTLLTDMLATDTDNLVRAFSHVNDLDACHDRDRG